METDQELEALIVALSPDISGNNDNSDAVRQLYALLSLPNTFRRITNFWLSNSPLRYKGLYLISSYCALADPDELAECIPLVLTRLQPSDFKMLEKPIKSLEVGALSESIAYLFSLFLNAQEFETKAALALLLLDILKDSTLAYADNEIQPEQILPLMEFGFQMVNNSNHPLASNIIHSTVPVCSIFADITNQNYGQHLLQIRGTPFYTGQYAYFIETMRLPSEYAGPVLSLALQIIDTDDSSVSLRAATFCFVLFHIRSVDISLFPHLYDRFIQLTLDNCQSEEQDQNAAQLYVALPSTASGYYGVSFVYQVVFEAISNRLASQPSELKVTVLLLLVPALPNLSVAETARHSDFFRGLLIDALSSQSFPVILTAIDVIADIYNYLPFPFMDLWPSLKELFQTPALQAVLQLLVTIFGYDNAYLFPLIHDIIPLLAAPPLELIAQFNLDSVLSFLLKLVLNTIAAIDFSADEMNIIETFCLNAMTSSELVLSAANIMTQLSVNACANSQPILLAGLATFWDELRSDEVDLLLCRSFRSSAMHFVDTYILTMSHEQLLMMKPNQMNLVARLQFLRQADFIVLDSYMRYNVLPAISCLPSTMWPDGAYKWHHMLAFCSPNFFYTLCTKTDLSLWVIKWLKYHPDAAAEVMPGLLPPHYIWEFEWDCVPLIRMLIKIRNGYIFHILNEIVTFWQAANDIRDNSYQICSIIICFYRNNIMIVDPFMAFFLQCLDQFGSDSEYPGINRGLLYQTIGYVSRTHPEFALKFIPQMLQVSDNADGIVKGGALFALFSIAIVQNQQPIFETILRLLQDAPYPSSSFDQLCMIWLRCFPTYSPQIQHAIITACLRIVYKGGCAINFFGCNINYLVPLLYRLNEHNLLQPVVAELYGENPKLNERIARFLQYEAQRQAQQPQPN